MRVTAQAAPTARLELSLTISLTKAEAEELRESLTTVEDVSNTQWVLMQSIDAILSKLLTIVAEEVTI